MTEQEMQLETLKLNKQPDILPGIFPSPVDIPDGIRSWIKGLIPQPQIKKIVIRKSHTVFQTAGLTKDVDLFTLPKYGEILTAWINIPTAFAGTTTYTMSLGPDTAETTLQTAQDVNTTGLKLAVGTDFTTNRPIYSTTTSTLIQARATSTVDNLSSSTAGIVDFHITYIVHGETSL